MTDVCIDQVCLGFSCLMCRHTSTRLCSETISKAVLRDRPYCEVKRSINTLLPCPAGRSGTLCSFSHLAAFLLSHGCKLKGKKTDTSLASMINVFLTPKLEALGFS